MMTQPVSPGPSDKVERLPLVPLRDVVVFPYTMIPFVVGRKTSLLAVEAALASDKKLFLSTQRDARTAEPKPDEINYIGAVVNIVQSLKLPNGNIKLLVEGVSRGKVLEIRETNGYFTTTLEPIDVRPEMSPEMEVEMGKAVSLFEKYVKLSPNLPYETMISTIRVSEPGRLTDTIAAHLQVGVEEKQNLLETFDPKERLVMLVELLEGEIEKLRVDRRIHHRVKEKIEAAKMPKEAYEKAIQELKRLEVMPPVSAEATVSRNYLEWLLAVPWSKKSRELRDIAAAERILNEDHFGLEKVKERILEFLAVRQLVKKTKGSILCFVGPPGVGKTSLAKSIA